MSDDIQTANSPFWRLAVSAFGAMAADEPVVVEMASNSGSAATNTGGLGHVVSLPSIQVNSDEAMPGVVSEQLATRPVLLIPPWGRRKLLAKASALNVLSLPTTREEAILSGCRPLNTASVLGVVVPASLLNSHGSRRARESMLANWRIAHVVYGDNAFPNVDARFQIALVLLRGGTRPHVPVRIFRIPRHGEQPADVEADFRRLLRQGGGRTRHGYVIRDLLPPGESLAFDRHDPDVLARRTDLSGFGAAPAIRDLYELATAGLPNSVLLHHQCSADTPGAARLVSGRDVLRDGAIATPDSDSRWVQAPSEVHLRAGDMVTRSIFSSSDSGGLACAEIQADDLPVVPLAGTVIALRPIQEMRTPHRQFAMLFLRSSMAKRFLSAEMNNQHILTWRSLREVPVPQPDHALAGALDDLREAQAKLGLWKDEAEAIIESVFLEQSAQRARANIVSLGRTLRARVEAGSLLDDSDHLVRTQYPHPVAFRWRSVEAQLSNGYTLESYLAILEAAEVLLCYCAHLCMAMAANAGVELRWLSEIRSKLVSHRSGPGLGDWIAVLQEISGRTFRDLGAGTPLGELRSYFSREDVDQARQRIATLRNDWSHLRRESPARLRQVINDGLSDLKTLTGSADFLADLPLVYIESSRWDRLRGVSTVAYRELRGDHPIVSTQVAEVPSNEIESQSLYIGDPRKDMLPLRPFLVGLECPECSMWSTFHVDTAPEGTVSIKSLEHGHTMRDRSLIEPLEGVGLL